MIENVQESKVLNLINRVTPEESENTPTGFRNYNRESLKLKALNFKQNMEILNLLEAFDEDSQLDYSKEGKKIDNY